MNMSASGEVTQDGVPWAQLKEAARAACAKSYAPYSNYRVGAAAVTEAGLFLSGSNVENASYGLTLCAECSLVSALIASGGGRFAAVLCVNSAGDLITPCGRCRQLLWEHAAPGAQLLTKRGPRLLADLLPDAFDNDDLQELSGNEND